MKVLDHIDEDDIAPVMEAIQKVTKAIGQLRMELGIDSAETIDPETVLEILARSSKMVLDCSTHKEMTPDDAVQFALTIVEALTDQYGGAMEVH